MNRKERQKQRIQNGVATGELTNWEAKQLQEDQQQIKQVRKALNADGKVDKQDKKILEEMRDEASKKIYNQKHDKQFVDDSLAEDKRKINNRIEDGVEDGELTEGELAKIKEEKQEFKFLKRELATDEDGLTDADIKVLEKEADDLKQKIKNKKHNNNVAQ